MFIKLAKSDSSPVVRAKRKNDHISISPPATDDSTAQVHDAVATVSKQNTKKLRTNTKLTSPEKVKTTSKTNSANPDASSNQSTRRTLEYLETPMGKCFN